MTRQLSGLCLACILALATGGCTNGLVGGNPTVTLTVDETSIDAAGGVATVTAALDGMSMQPVEVALEFGGTAVSGVSYTRSAMRIVIPSYATSGSITIRGASGTAFNPDAVVTVAIASVTGGTAAADQEPLSIAIVSDATAPTVSLSLPEDTTGEVVKEITEFDKNGGTIDVTAALSNTTWTEVTVNLAFAGSAENETDYTRSAETIVIPAGKKAGKITLTGADTDEFVNHKSVIVSIGSVVNAGFPADTSDQEVTAYLKGDADNIPTATLELDPKTISAAGGVATLTCTLDAPIPVDATVEFRLDLANTTAKYDKNFTISNKVESDAGDYWLLTVPAEQTTGSITITGMQRSDYFGDLDCVLTVGDFVNMSLADSEKGPFKVTIEDQHPKPQVTLSVAGSPIVEKDGQATVTLTQSEVSGADTIIVLSLSGMATNGTDYASSDTTVTIPKGELSQSMTITAKEDSVYEGNETVIVKINSVTNGEQVGVQQGTVVIIDGQTKPTVSLSLSSELLYETGGTAEVTATLSNATTKEVTVNLTPGGSAVQGTDYTISDTKIVIAAGNTGGSVVLQTLSGSHIGNTITVSLGTIVEATAGTPSEVTATISDVSVSLALDDTTIAENAGAATVTATLNKTIASAVTIQFGLTGTATKDTDYTASDNKIVIAAGQTSGTLTLTAIPDDKYDADETIVISTQSVQNAAVVGNTQFTATITDDYVQLPSGLRYKVLTAGPDPDNKPVSTDRVTANYVGTLVSGTEFDSGEDVEFPVNGVIAGWTEALQLMSVGSRWMLYIPAELGYGANPPAGSIIPPNSDLIFDVTLVSIVAP